MVRSRSLFRIYAGLGLLKLSVMCCAGVDMDHVHPEGTSLYTPGTPSSINVFTNFPEFSATVVEDFIASGSVVDTVQVAFEAHRGINLDAIEGWQISLWSSDSMAETSTNTLSQNTAAQMFVTGSHQSDMVLLSGTNATLVARKLTLSGLGLSGLTVGSRYWVGIAPRINFTNANGQFFVLANSNPSVVGAQAPNDAVWVNPGEGFGVGTRQPGDYNAAYSVTTVPEPSLVFSLLASLIAFRRRRAT